MNETSQPVEILIFSGAGLSAESGISTFRDVGGIWQTHNLNEVCNEGTWRENFEQVHHFYNQLRTGLADKQPNQAHRTIAQLQQKLGDHCHIVTQNVDDLLERAGCHNVLHVHGFITRMKCESCGRVWDIGYSEWHPHEDRCTCGSHKDVRPDIVFFGGIAPAYKTMYSLFDRVANHENNVVLVIGTEGNVIRINAMLRDTECKKILCNLKPTTAIDETLFTECYFEPATTALPKIKQWLEQFLK